jgi:hypothetical protein
MQKSRFLFFLVYLISLRFVTVEAQPPNDFIVNALPLSLGTFQLVTWDNNSLATANTTFYNVPTMYPANVPLFTDVWYYFNATATTWFNVSFCEVSNMNLAADFVSIYTSGASAASIETTFSTFPPGLNEEPTLLSAIQSGKLPHTNAMQNPRQCWMITSASNRMVYIRAGSVDKRNGSLSFYITIQNQSFIPGDDAANAIPLTQPGLYSSLLGYASPWPNTIMNTAIFVYDAWYSMSFPNTTRVRVSMCETNSTTQTYIIQQASTSPTEPDGAQYNWWTVIGPGAPVLGNNGIPFHLSCGMVCG